jgi:hypothetical protein
LNKSFQLISPRHLLLVCITWIMMDELKHPYVLHGNTSAFNQTINFANGLIAEISS